MRSLGAPPVSSQSQATETIKVLANAAVGSYRLLGRHCSDSVEFRRQELRLVGILDIPAESHCDLYQLSAQVPDS